MNSKTERAVELRQSGLTLRAIGGIIGLSHEGVRLLLRHVGISGYLHKLNNGKPTRDERRQTRFWNHVDIGNDDQCWEWKGCRYPTGYGHCSKCFAGGYAHRAAWEFVNGPIPSGLHICHKCDNPPCCNPNHLFLGTVADNMHDRDAKGRNGTRGIHKIFCKRGHEFTPENTYVLRGTRYCRACKREREAFYRSRKG